MEHGLEEGVEALPAGSWLIGKRRARRKTKNAKSDAVQANPALGPLKSVLTISLWALRQEISVLPIGSVAESIEAERGTQNILWIDLATNPLPA